MLKKYVIAVAVVLVVLVVAVAVFFGFQVVRPPQGKIAFEE